MNRFILSIIALCTCMSATAMNPAQAPSSPRRQIQQNNKTPKPAPKKYDRHDIQRRENFRRLRAHKAFHQAGAEIIYAGILNDANPPAANQN